MIKNILKSAVNNGRAVYRSVLGLALLPVAIGLVALQTLILKPLTGNTTAVTRPLAKIARMLLGYKVTVSANSAPIEKKNVWFLLNHQSDTDFVVSGSRLKGSYAGIDEIRHYPVIGRIAKSFGFIGIRRSKEHNAESRGAIISHFNAGRNVIMFPEGTTGATEDVNLFHAGLLTALFNDKAVDSKGQDVALKRDVVVQTVALRIKSVNGKPPTPESRTLYTMHGGKALPKLWKRLQVRKIELELTAFPPMNPHDFKDAKDLVNKAGWDVISVVNPGQKQFGKPVIKDTKHYNN